MVLCQCSLTTNRSVDTLGASKNLKFNAKEVIVKPAHAHTVAAQKRMLESLNFSDTRDFEDVRRGFVATLPDAAAPDGPGQ